MKVVLQTLLRARVASRTQSCGRVHYLRLGKGLCLLSWVGIVCRPSADVARRECFNALRMSTQKHEKTCDRVKITGLPSGQVGKRFTMASVKRIRFLNFSQAFGSGFYPEGPENTSTDSIIFKCASDVASQSKDRTAETT